MVERNTRIRASQIQSVLPEDLEATNSPSDNQVATYDNATAKFTWENQSGGKFKQSFTNSDLSSGILSVTHNLAEKYVQAVIYDNNDKQVVPDEITLVNTNSLTIDFTGLGSLTGTWNLIILG